MRLFLRNYSHMAAITQRLLLRPVRCRELRQFSSSSGSDPPPHPPGDSQPKTEPAPSFSSYFKDVSAQLENRPRKFSFSNRPIYGTPRQSTEQIHKSLAEFRILSAAPPPSTGPGQHGSFDIIRENLRTKSPTAPGTGGGNRSDVSDPLSIARLKENLKPNPDQGKTPVISGSNYKPYFLTKGIKDGQDNAEDRNEGMRTALVKSYDCKELGEELKKLRPEKRKGKWFSLNELNERLAKLKVIAMKDPQNTLGVIVGIRGVLADHAKKEVQDKKKKSSYKLGILSSIGGTPKYMLKAPKENLVEKYYHPDNMSSAEKLKIELQRVRDEFKMSESDCGSARVQVAQLTTKIKHLSNVLSKKDKHSRKGLQDMVQRRKKLLKYLSRTDWDSYCLVRSKLGLRDNPDIKA